MNKGKQEKQKWRWDRIGLIGLTILIVGLLGSWEGFGMVILFGFVILTFSLTKMEGIDQYTREGHLCSYCTRALFRKHINVLVVQRINNVWS